MRVSLCCLLLTTLLAIGCPMVRNAKQTSASLSGSIGVAPDSDPKTGAKEEVGRKIEIDCTQVMVERGKTAKLLVRATRKDTNLEKMYQGAIQLEFDTSDVPGLKIEPAVIAAGQTEVEVKVTAAADAAQGTGFIEITAKGEGVDPYGPVRVQATVK